MNIRWFIFTAAFAGLALSGSVLRSQTKCDTVLSCAQTAVDAATSADTSAKALQDRVNKLESLVNKLDSFVKSAKIECGEVTAGNGSQDATCPSGWVATGCSAGSNKGSHSIVNQITCRTDQPVDWTRAHCCHVVFK